MGPNFLTCARGVDDTVLQRIYTSRKQHKRTATLEGFHRIARRPPGRLRVIPSFFIVGGAAAYRFQSGKEKQANWLPVGIGHIA